MSLSQTTRILSDMRRLVKRRAAEGSPDAEKSPLRRAEAGAGFRTASLLAVLEHLQRLFGIGLGRVGLRPGVGQFLAVRLVETTEHFLVVVSFATQYCVAANAGTLNSATTEAATKTLRIIAFSQVE
ncbi:hypothetical protein [Mesorhizobium sp. M2C.T.Ca.TU.002.02.1.1]|uniref:hypothetical protein n=1 Tax=Mesorhizobium sp. M2C.T.Ca.TU.002.02.1.1 TaxID=2496788 RepID=UPI0013E3A7F1|nr:hypothetical protein [Mesorhizobium sp. M2C.T.Ca.TU.002.02.1.1]